MKELKKKNPKCTDDTYLGWFSWNSGRVLAPELGSTTEAMNQQDCKTWLGFIMVYPEVLQLENWDEQCGCQSPLL